MPPTENTSMPPTENVSSGAPPSLSLPRNSPTPPSLSTRAPLAATPAASCCNSQNLGLCPPWLRLYLFPARRACPCCRRRSPDRARRCFERPGLAPPRPSTSPPPPARPSLASATRGPAAAAGRLTPNTSRPAWRQEQETARRERLLLLLLLLSVVGLSAAGRLVPAAEGRRRVSKRRTKSELYRPDPSIAIPVSREGVDLWLALGARRGEPPERGPPTPVEPTALSKKQPPRLRRKPSLFAPVVPPPPTTGELHRQEPSAVTRCSRRFLLLLLRRRLLVWSRRDCRDRF